MIGLGQGAEGILGRMSRFPRMLLLATLLFVWVIAPPTVSAGPTPDTAEALLQQMTPEARIGQLFLVTFRGSTAPDDSEIASLIRDYHVSGVVLSMDNNNLVDAPNTTQALHDLADSLQTLDEQAALAVPGLNPAIAANSEGSPVYVPLFIGISDPPNSVPLTDVIGGMSPLPSEMAIGATWDPSLARSVGSVLGQELEAMGINLYVGPSLDVLEDPGLGSPGDLGVETFGGDPYWVSQMGKAYIEGLHEGSSDRIAVIAQHFPGHGGSDRPLQEEVATVRKSLDQLMQIELPPFFSVTAADPGSDASIADGLLTSHIRYQGFQGNIRATTRPISLDPEAFAQLMSLDPLKAWRAAGGLTMSDSLGSRAIRRFRDPTERTFPAHLVARDALVAGNDLLYLSNFRDPTDPDELTTIKSTLAFFTQKYQEDKVFAQRVDEAVLRILRAKLRLYGGTFTLETVLPNAGEMANVGKNRDVSFTVAGDAATLISPNASQIEDRVGGPPQLGQRIVFFTDVRLVQPCTSCEAKPLMATNALENRVLSLYGPGAAGQVGNWNIESYTMADLASYLGNPPSKPPPIPIVSADTIDESLRAADWVVFSVLDSNDSVYGADALKQLLEARPDLTRSKRVVVFSFDIPYGLDATNVSKVDLYYGLYSPLPSFIDVAARLLFQEVSAPGTLPVSVSGIGYDLINALKPDPNQVIGLTIKGESGENSSTPTATGFEQGNLVTLETNVIVDASGHRVPDDTPVEFILSYQGENLSQTVESETTDGVAETTFRLDRLGLLTIQARSDPALRSNVLQLNVQEGVAAFPTVIAPTPFPTNTPPPTNTPGPATATPPAEQPGAAGPGAAGGTGPMVFLGGLLGAAIAGAMGFLLAEGMTLGASRIRIGLLAAAGALLAYNYLALGLPGAASVVNGLGSFGGLLASVVGGLLTLTGAWAWVRFGPFGLAERS
jgi:beta-N-acetylhexosaminidase